MITKIYGIHGLLEWHGTIQAGAIRMSISFTNGTMTGYGIAPATFVTSDTLTQYVIEHCEQFKKGRIKLMNTYGEADEPKEEVKAEDAKTDERINVAEETAGNSSQSVSVKDKTDAIEWLKDNFPDKGYTYTKLRTKEAFTAACEDCGVTFVFEA